MPLSSVQGYPGLHSRLEASSGVLSLRPTTQMSEEELRRFIGDFIVSGQRYVQLRGLILWSKKPIQDYWREALKYIKMHNEFSKRE